MLEFKTTSLAVSVSSNSPGRQACRITARHDHRKGAGQTEVACAHEADASGSSDLGEPAPATSCCQEHIANNDHWKTYTHYQSGSTWPQSTPGHHISPTDYYCRTGVLRRIPSNLRNQTSCTCLSK